MSAMEVVCGSRKGNDFPCLILFTGFALKSFRCTFANK